MIKNVIENFPKFRVGQLIHHKKFDYRGVIFQVDAIFKGTDAWYEQVAKSRPPRDQPWYHVMVHNSASTTYVAERHLGEDMEKTLINNPIIAKVFSSIENGEYRRILH